MSEAKDRANRLELLHNRLRDLNAEILLSRARLDRLKRVPYSMSASSVVIHKALEEVREAKKELYSLLGKEREVLNEINNLYRDEKNIGTVEA